MRSSLLSGRAQHQTSGGSFVSLTCANAQAEPPAQGTSVVVTRRRQAVALDPAVRPVRGAHYCRSVTEPTTTALRADGRRPDQLRPVTITRNWRDSVAAVSVGIIGGIPMLDLPYSEDVCADTDMNVVVTGSGGFVEVQGTAEQTPFDRTELDVLLDLAVSGIARLTELQSAALAVGGRV